MSIWQEDSRCAAFQLFFKGQTVSGCGCSRALDVSSPGRCVVQEALLRDQHTLDADRLAYITGSQLQELLSLPSPMPEQDKRASLLREV